MKKLMQLFEQGLWLSRTMVLVGVLASVAIGLGVLVVVSIDAADLLAKVATYPGALPAARDELRREIISGTVGVVDGYLLTAIMLLFGFGIYELFVSRIEAIDRSEMGASLLRVHSVDDLKDRLGRVVVIILVVKFCQQALDHKYGGAADLLYLAAATVLIAGALFLSGKKTSRPPGLNP